MVTRRAIRRLDFLEWAILAVGAAMAVVGGAGVAWLVAGEIGWSFRATWITASVVLFVVPGGIAIVKARREEREDALRAIEAQLARGRQAREGSSERVEGDHG